MAGTDGRNATADLPEDLPFAEILGNAPFGVLMIDDTSTVRYANGGLSDLLGYKPATIVGEPLLRVVPERLHDSHMRAFDSYLETGEKHLDWDQIELPALHRSGREVPVSVAIRETPIGGESFYTGIITDNTESTRLRSELKESIDALHELYTIASNTAMPFETRRDRILDAGCQYLGLPYGFVTEITPTKQRILASVGDHKLLQPNAECPIERSYCRKTIEGDGFLAVANAVSDGWEDDPAYERFKLGSYVGGKLIVNGELFGTLCFAAQEPRGKQFTDSERTFVEMATRWLGYELQQQQQTQQLERQNERLDQFASQVSHDLRNPISAAMGRLDIAIEQYGDDEDLQAVKRSLEDADSRINEMLEFARLGGIVTDPEAVPLADTAEAAWDPIETAGATIDIVDDVELCGDPERIERLLENLFRNAVEHGSTAPDSQARRDGIGHGGSDLGVSVRVGPLSNAPGFFIEDDGPGIPESDRGDVLEFGYTTSDSGSGFGLAIVEQIATAHDWDVKLTESEAGGVRFEFDGSIQQPG